MEGENRMSVKFDLSELIEDTNVDTQQVEDVLTKITELNELIQKNTANYNMNLDKLKIGWRPEDGNVTAGEIWNGLCEYCTSEINLQSLSMMKFLAQTYSGAVYQVLCATGMVPLFAISNERKDSQAVSKFKELRDEWNLITSIFDNRHKFWWEDGDLIASYVAGFGLCTAKPRHHRNTHKIQFFIVCNSEQDKDTMLRSTTSDYSRNILLNKIVVISKKTYDEILLGTNNPYNIEILFKFDKLTITGMNGNYSVCKFTRKLKKDLPVYTLSVSTNKWEIGSFSDFVACKERSKCYADMTIHQGSSVKFDIITKANFVPYLFIVNGKTYIADYLNYIETAETVIRWTQSTHENVLEGQNIWEVELVKVNSNIAMHVEFCSDTTMNRPIGLISKQSEIIKRENAIQLNLKLGFPIIWLNTKLVLIQAIKYETDEHPAIVYNVENATITMDDITYRDIMIHTRIPYQDSWFENPTTLKASEAGTNRDVVNQNPYCPCMNTNFTDSSKYQKPEKDAYWHPDFPGRMNPNPTVKYGSYTTPCHVKYSEYCESGNHYLKVTLGTSRNIRIIFDGYEDFDEFDVYFNNYAVCIDVSKPNGANQLIATIPAVKPARFINVKDVIETPETPPVLPYPPHHKPWDGIEIDPAKKQYFCLTAQGDKLSYTKDTKLYDILTTKPLVSGPTLEVKDNVISIADIDNMKDGKIPVYVITLRNPLLSDEHGHTIPMARVVSIIHYKDTFIFANQFKPRLIYCDEITSCMNPDGIDLVSNSTEVTNPVVSTNPKLLDRTKVLEGELEDFVYATSEGKSYLYFYLKQDSVKPTDGNTTWLFDVTDMKVQQWTGENEPDAEPQPISSMIPIFKENLTWVILNNPRYIVDFEITASESVDTYTLNLTKTQIMDYTVCTLENMQIKDSYLIASVNGQYWKFIITDSSYDITNLADAIKTAKRVDWVLFVTDTNSCIVVVDDSGIILQVTATSYHPEDSTGADNTIESEDTTSDTIVTEGEDDTVPEMTMDLVSGTTKLLNNPEVSEGEYDSTPELKKVFEETDSGISTASAMETIEPVAEKVEEKDVIRTNLKCLAITNPSDYGVRVKDSNALYFSVEQLGTEKSCGYITTYKDDDISDKLTHLIQVAEEVLLAAVVETEVFVQIDNPDVLSLTYLSTDPDTGYQETKTEDIPINTKTLAPVYAHMIQNPTTPVVCEIGFTYMSVVERRQKVIYWFKNQLLGVLQNKLSVRSSEFTIFYIEYDKNYLILRLMDGADSMQYLIEVSNKEIKPL